jgi:hypothetical protein
MSKIYIGVSIFLFIIIIICVVYAFIKTCRTCLNIEDGKVKFPTKVVIDGIMRVKENSKFKNVKEDKTLRIKGNTNVKGKIYTKTGVTTLKNTLTKGLEASSVKDNVINFGSSSNARTLRFEEDGDIVLYKKEGTTLTPLWTTDTN